MTLQVPAMDSQRTHNKLSFGRKLILHGMLFAIAAIFFPISALSTRTIFPCSFSPSSKAH